MEPAPTVEAVPAEMAAEGAKEVDEGMQKILEEDLCRHAAMMLMPLDQTVLYTSHRRGPQAAEISAGPGIDVSGQPCAPEDCPLGPFLQEEEELEATTPSKFPVIATQPGGLMVVREGRFGGMVVVEDTVDLRSPKYFDGMWQAPTRASLTRPSRSNRGLWWPTMSARRITSPLANIYVPAAWWGQSLRQNGRLGAGGAGRWLEVLLEGVLALEGSGRRVPKRCWKGFRHPKGPLEGSAGREFQRWKAGSSRAPARGSSAGRGSSRGVIRGSSPFRSPLFPCISGQMPLLAPLVDLAKGARATPGTRGYAGPDGLGCTDHAAQPDTKVAIAPGTTSARIRLTRPLLASNKQPRALTNWLHGVLEVNLDVPVLQVRVHADDLDDITQACTGRANPTVNKTQRRHVGMDGTALLFAAHKPTTKKAGKDKYPFKHPHLDTLRYAVDSKPAISLPN